MTVKISEIGDALATVVGDELLEVTATPSGTPTTKTVTPTVLTAAATAHAASDGTSHANVVLNGCESCYRQWFFAHLYQSERRHGSQPDFRQGDCTEFRCHQRRNGFHD
jgi:hypothetical protein